MAILCLIYIFSILYLTCKYRSKKELTMIGIIFCLIFFIRYYGALGNFWINSILCIIMACLLYGIYLLYSYIIARWNVPLVTLIFPLIWLIVYGFISLIHYPSIARIDILITDLPILLQIERVIGSTAFSFLLLWLMALISYALLEHKPVMLANGILLFMIPMIYGGIIISHPMEQSDKSIKIAYTTGPYVGDFTNYETLPLEEYTLNMQNAVREASKKGAGILVFTEEAFEIDDQEEEGFVKECCQEAKANAIHLLITFDLNDTDQSENGKAENKIIWIDDQGEILGSYSKRNLVPVVEAGYVKGDGNIPFHTIEVNGQEVNVSYLICYDSNFPFYLKKIKDDTDILILPSWDWKSVKKKHRDICRSVAIETRLCIFKPTYDGYSILLNERGEILYSADCNDIGYGGVEILDIPLKNH